MRKKKLVLLLLISALLLVSCRYAVIETGSVVIAPTAEVGER